MKKILIVINDAPYGTEKAYNALRMALTLQKEHSEEVEIKIFLLADAVFCGLPNQNTPNGYYNIERMLKIVIRNGGEVKSCGGCSEARGIDKIPFVEGVKLSNMKEFAQWTMDADKVLTFQQKQQLDEYLSHYDEKSIWEHYRKDSDLKNL